MKCHRILYKIGGDTIRNDSRDCKIETVFPCNLGIEEIGARFKKSPLQVNYKGHNLPRGSKLAYKIIHEKFQDNMAVTIWNRSVTNVGQIRYYGFPLIHYY